LKAYTPRSSKQTNSLFYLRRVHSRVLGVRATRGEFCANVPRSIILSGQNGWFTLMARASASASGSLVV
ncbi:MAG: hypothetical protein ACPGWR_04995, partial [Ardenticatenaceae bacterium]